VEEERPAPQAEPPPDVPGGTVESTASLLALARAGDQRARGRLVARYLPSLRRWAHGRLPVGARDLVDTDDLVQITLVRALNRLEGFEPRREGAFLAYLRTILVNQIRDQARRAGRNPGREALSEAILDPARTPLEEIIGRETLESYERALAWLTSQQREAVVLRVELEFSYPEIAEALGSPSANAARMLVARAFVRMAEVMDAPFR